MLDPPSVRSWLSRMPGMWLRAHLGSVLVQDWLWISATVLSKVPAVIPKLTFQLLQYISEAKSPIITTFNPASNITHNKTINTTPDNCCVFFVDCVCFPPLWLETHWHSLWWKPLSCAPTLPTHTLTIIFALLSIPLFLLVSNTDPISRKVATPPWKFHEAESCYLVIHLFLFFNQAKWQLFQVTLFYLLKIKFAVLQSLVRNHHHHCVFKDSVPTLWLDKTRKHCWIWMTVEPS